MLFAWLLNACCCLLSVARPSLFEVCRLSCVVCCLYLLDRCLLCVVCCVLFVGCCLLFVVCFWLFVMLLFVVRCVLLDS